MPDHIIGFIKEDFFDFNYDRDFFKVLNYFFFEGLWKQKNFGVKLASLIKLYFFNLIFILINAFPLLAYFWLNLISFTLLLILLLGLNLVFFGSGVILFRNVWILMYNFLKEARRFSENIEFFDHSLKVLKDEVI